MIVLDFPQGSEEWAAARCGKVGASRIGDLTAKTKTGWGASRANLAAEKVAERLTGVPADKYTSLAMAWGRECEPEARAMYEFMTDTIVSQVGLVLHPTIEMSCASPDGLVGTAGLLEIKCPNTSTHIDTLLGAEIDGRYLKQMAWQMACTGRAWVDFVSFDPRMPAEMQLHVRRVNRDEPLIRELEREVAIFLKEVDATVEKLTELYRAKEAA